MVRIAVMTITALAATTPGAAAPVNAFNQRLLGLDRVNQLAIIRQAIEDGGGICAHVVGAVYRGPYKNLERWDAACDRGGDYGVFVGPDGTSQTRRCTDIATLRLPACRPIAVSRTQSRKTTR